MNSRTKSEFVKFIDSIANMAIGCVHMLGEQQVREILEQGQNLKACLDRDETIKEPRQ